MAELIAGSDTSRAYLAYIESHWRELIERYDPWLLWSDIGYPPGYDLAELFADYYNHTPEGVVNDRWLQLPKFFFSKFGRFVLTRMLRRMGQGEAPRPAHCDFVTPEYATLDHITSHKWETCRGIGNSFGYNQFEGLEEYQKAQDLVRLLADIVSKNGDEQLGRKANFNDLRTSGSNTELQAFANQAWNEQKKEIYEFQQDAQGRRQLALAGPIAEESARSREYVHRETELAGMGNILGSLTSGVQKMFVPGSTSDWDRNMFSFDLRKKIATDTDVAKYVSVLDGLRAQLARAGGEVGNLAATEQTRAAELAPDPFGHTIDRFPFYRGPDTQEVATAKLRMAAEFVQTSLQAPRG